MTAWHSHRAWLALSLSLAACGPSAPPSECVSNDECGAGRTCVDGACVAITPMDASTPRDAGHRDAAEPPADATTPPRDAGPDAACISTVCADSEVCYDGLDNDCNGSVDEGCSCTPGSTSRCLPGSVASSARCSWGEMTCAGSGEFGSWGACTGGGGLDGGSSLYGCRRIGIMGAPGANPSSNFQAWLEMQGAIVTRFQDTSSAPTLQRAELETFDLVIVDWLQRTYSTEEATTLSDWVLAGGALMVMTGHDSGATADRHVSLLATLGPTFDRAAGPLSGPATLLAHPTTMTADGTGTLPPVSFYGGLRTIVPAELTSTIVPMAVIGSDVVGVAGPLGEGHVLLFGDEWIEFDSEWSTMPPIPQLWLNTVQWLAPDMPVLPACE